LDVAVELSQISPKQMKVLLSDLDQLIDIRQLVARWFGNFPALRLLSCQRTDRLPADAAPPPGNGTSFFPTLILAVDCRLLQLCVRIAEFMVISR
jgi:hypothetical protein